MTPNQAPASSASAPHLPTHSRHIPFLSPSASSLILRPDHMTSIAPFHAPSSPRSSISSHSSPAARESASHASHTRTGVYVPAPTYVRACGVRARSAVSEASSAPCDASKWRRSERMTAVYPVAGGARSALRAYCRGQVRLCGMGCWSEAYRRSARGAPHSWPRQATRHPGAASAAFRATFRSRLPTIVGSG